MTNPRRLDVLGAADAPSDPSWRGRFEGDVKAVLTAVWSVRARLVTVGVLTADDAELLALFSRARDMEGYWR